MPSDRFHCQFDCSLDLSFVRGFVANESATGGRRSFGSAEFFKLQLVLLVGGTRSELQLITLASDRLSVRWFLGCDLGEPLPVHASFTRISHVPCRAAFVNDLHVISRHKRS